MMATQTTKERPILFSAQMVNAILAGRKTQTRRIVKPQPLWVGDPGVPFKTVDANPKGIIRCPYGVPGDRLWVREAFIHEPADYCWEASVSIPCRPAHTIYRADCKGDTRGAGWRSPIHMPRSLSRLTLEIKDIRVERLQDISEADAVAEGCDGKCPVGFVPAYRAGPYSYHFAQLWESINGPGSWDANPWVWVIAFKRIERTA